MRVLRIFLLLMPVALAACQTPGPAGLSKADKAAIEASSRTFVEKANAGDWEALAALYTENAVVLPPNQSAVQGRANLQAWFEAFPPLTDFSLENVEIDGCGDLAFVRGNYKMTLTPEGASPIIDSGKFIEIRRKQADGSWPLARDIFNSDIALPE